MSKYTSTNTNGKCLSKNHPLYGNIYLNLNKNNIYYIRTKNKDMINNTLFQMIIIKIKI